MTKDAWEEWIDTLRTEGLLKPETDDTKDDNARTFRHCRALALIAREAAPSLVIDKSLHPAVLLFHLNDVLPLASSGVFSLEELLSLFREAEKQRKLEPESMHPDQTGTYRRYVEQILSHFAARGGSTRKPWLEVERYLEGDEPEVLKERSREIGEELYNSVKEEP